MLRVEWLSTYYLISVVGNQPGSDDGADQVVANAFGLPFFAVPLIRLASGAVVTYPWHELFPFRPTAKRELPLAVRAAGGPSGGSNSRIKSNDFVAAQSKRLACSCRWSQNRALGISALPTATCQPIHPCCFMACKRRKQGESRKE